MPKPTTHTDIVIVTKSDTPAAPRRVESIQLNLVGIGTLDGQSQIIGEETSPIEVGPKEDLNGPPTGLLLKPGGKTLELAYQARVIHSGDYGQMVNEPWPRPQGQVSQPISGSFVWKNTAPDAQIKEFVLSIYATLDGTKLTVNQQASSENGTQRLLLKFMDGAEQMGELTMIAVMEALLGA